MKLTKIEIEQFGGLKNYSLTFTGGPLYIYGENEAGKSTICAFIAAMFYGLAGKVRNGGLKGDSRNLYMPWGETYMAGTVYFTAEGKDYVLKRRFGRTTKGDRISLLSAEDWQEIAIDKDELGQRFLGVGEDAFRKTLFISQLGAAFEKGKEDELVSRLSNLEQGGEEDTSVQKALEELEKAQHGLLSKTGRGGVLTQLDSEIESLQTELLEAKEQNRAFQSVLEEVRQLTQEVAQGEQTLSNLSKERKKAIAFEAFLDRKKEWELQEQQKQQLEIEKNALQEAEKKSAEKEQEKAELVAVLNLDQSYVLALLEKEARCGVLKQQCAEQEAVAEEIRKLEEQLTTQPDKKGKKILLLLLIVSLVAAGAILGTVLMPAFYGMVPLSLLLLLFTNGGKKEKEAQLALLAKLSEKKELLERLSQEHPETALKQLQDEIFSALYSAGADTVQTLSEKIEAAKDVLRQIEALTEEINRKKETVRQLQLSVEAISPMPVEEMQYDGPTAETLDEQLEALRRVQLERERRLAQLNAQVESGFSGKRSVSVIESALSDAVQKKQELTEYYEIILLAKAMLEACGEELKNTFAPVLNKTSGKLIDKLTAGRYQEVRITDAYKIMLKTPAGNEIVPSEYVSAGTYDLLYFALRLAVLHTLYDKIPLLMLDDTFVQLDEKRRQTAFSFLQEETAEQILYFSCHKPPEVWDQEQIIML